MLGIGQISVDTGFNIFVKTNTGSTLPINLAPDWNVKEIKNVIATKLGLQPEEIKIIFAGKELMDTTAVSECDLGEKTIIHAITLTHSINNSKEQEENEAASSTSKPLCEILQAMDFYNEADKNVTEQAETLSEKMCFYVYCSSCKGLRTGKLRVHCEVCKSGAFTVLRDPQEWKDVLDPKRVPGLCENESCPAKNAKLNYAQFFFKCASHISLGEQDEAVPLDLIKNNSRNISCLSCGEIGNPVLVFPCEEGHVVCLECFIRYCNVRLSERQFIEHPQFGYTLSCPAGCADSFIKENHHFRLLDEAQYERYHKFATEEFVLKAGGLLCPQRDCGMGILVDSGCRRVACIWGCGHVFCRDCRRPFHTGACEANDGLANVVEDSYTVDRDRANRARWDEASRKEIQRISIPCPKCNTPTERNGGCMHMHCVTCDTHWCWFCKNKWTRDCMANHWFN